MPSLSRILKRDIARPDGLFTVGVRQPPLVEAVQAGEDDRERKRLEAEEMLASAKRQAELLVREGEARREAIEKQAYEAGYQRGYAEALKQAQAEAERLRAEAVALLAEARRLREEIIAASEPEVVELALAVAARVVHRQLQVEPETVVSVVRAALQRLRRRRQLVVFVNPQDLEVVRSQREGLQQELGEGATLYFLADPAIAPGGCRVESEGGQADSTIDGQLQRLRQALLELVPPPGQAPENISAVGLSPGEGGGHR